MTLIIHNDTFMDATPIKRDAVAAIWDRPHGGQIVDYIHLGEHGSVKSAQAEAREWGLKLRQSQVLSFGPSVSVAGVNYANPFHVHAYNPETT